MSRRHDDHDGRRDGRRDDRDNRRDERPAKRRGDQPDAGARAARPAATRTHGRVPSNRPARARNRRETSGSATGAIVRPAARHSSPRTAPATQRNTDRAARRRDERASTRPSARAAAPTEQRSKRRFHGKVASIGEARAHKVLRESRTPPSPPSPKLRARRINTTKAVLSTRFGVGRPRLRLRVTLVALLMILTSVIVKVGWIQGEQGDSLRAAAAGVWERTSVLPAKRGSIFDRSGAELALSVPAATVTLNPQQVEFPMATAQALGTILGFTADEISALGTKIAEDKGNGIGFRYIARQIEPNLAKQISELEIAGVRTESEERRMIPGGTVGLGILGQTDIDGIGISGLELQFNELLTGTPGERTREIAHGGRSIAGSEMLIEPIPGTDLVTSIDLSLQFAAEQALLKQVTAVGGEGGQVIIMRTNGDIVAMASVERGADGYVRVSRGNWAAVGAYEPGSVAKVISVAGALNEGVVDEGTWMDVADNYRCTRDPNVAPLRDARPHATVSMNPRKILSESSNVGTIMISRRMEYAQLYHYMTAFGLGSPTGLGFPNESAGILKPWEKWEGTERCTVAYGSGFAATPIQMAAAVNVIANNGVHADPRLVTHLVDTDGSLVELPPSATREVISPETARTMQSMMKEVVCNGTAKAAQVDGLSVAGKTGTSYKTQPNGTYFNERGTRDYYVSFVGFFPAENPEVTVLVAVDEPQHGTSGGQSAAPLFQQLVPVIVTELGIQPPPGSNGCGNGF